MEPVDQQDQFQGEQIIQSNLIVAQNQPDTGDRVLQAVAQFIESQTDAQRRQAPHVEPIHMQFLKFDPPDFFGSTKPLEAEEWLKRMESIFDVMRVTDEEKMILAPFKLKGKSVEAFNDHYFPMAYRYEQERAFIPGKQGQISINDFEAQFTVFSRFAPDLVRTEEAKCRRFLDGLNADIRRGVEPFEITNYADLVSKAKIVEKGLKEWKQEQETI
ncbi:hypothetical protein Acr_03g0012340 [Actinidia rufa]|uniref:Retrotransposon gag domain-containing protein n=1 Tax=Actinidia rufa TaxID=165716 RepID=A0A7J0EDK0_9ERIC|nr:hypothetical protein Acr_03g0012340 [Actinidia rufa]